MHVKTFQAADMPELLELVKNELSPHAVLLSVRRLPADEGQDCPGLLEGTAAFDPEARTLVQPEAPRSLPAQPMDAYRPLQIPSEHPETLPKLVLLAGPKGHGKTASAAKLAAYLGAQAQRPVALLAIEADSLTASGTLGSYARTLGLPMIATRTAPDLLKALTTWSARGPVVIDTPGLPAGNGGRLSVVIDLLRQQGHEPQVHLVLRADTPASQVPSTLREFAPLGLDRILLTNLDRCRSAENVMEAVRHSGLSLSYLGTGTRVPEDLQVPA